VLKTVSRVAECSELLEPKKATMKQTCSCPKRMENEEDQ
jgi:hypothetical protein